MPMTRIEIEELAGNKWVAEVQAGRVARREVVRSDSAEGIIDAVYATFRRMVPNDPKTPARTVAQPIDESLLPHKPIPPIGKHGAMQKRRGRPPINR